MATVLESHELRSDEMNNIRRALGSTASPLIAVVARLFLAHPEGRSWQDTQCWGAVVLVMDRLRNARIIRMFDLQNYDVVFDEELYVGMNYVAARPYFHTFEVEGAVVGLDFCNHNDAKTFHSRVLAMIPRPRQIPAGAITSDFGDKPKGGFFGQFKRIIGMKRESSVSEIGAPTNVKHTQHIGFDPEKGFEIQNIPNEWKTLFKGAGIKPSHLKDRETAQAVFDTIRRTIATGTATKTKPPIAPANIPRPARAATVSVAPPPRAVIQPELLQQRHKTAGQTRTSSRSQSSASVQVADIGIPPPPPLPDAAPVLHPPRTQRGQLPSRTARPTPHPPAPKQVRAPIPEAPAVPPAPLAPSVPVAPPVLKVPPPIAVPKSQNASPSSSDDSSRATLMSAIRNFSGDKLKVTPKNEDDSVQLPNLQEMDSGSKNSLMFQIKSVMDARRGVLATNADDDDEDDDDEWD